MLGFSQTDRDKKLRKAIMRLREYEGGYSKSTKAGIASALENGGNPLAHVNGLSPLESFLYNSCKHEDILGMLLDKVDTLKEVKQLRIPEQITTTALTLLLDKGLSPSMLADDSNSFLCSLMERQKWECCDLLISRGALKDPDIFTPFNPLMAALRHGASRQMIARIIDKTPDVNAAFPGNGFTALHYGADSGHIQGMKVLVQNPRLNLDLLDKQRSTALHLAARMNSASIGEELIARGISIDGENSAGETPLSLYATYGNAVMVRLLLETAAERGIELDLEPALRAAAERGYDRVVKTLLAAGANVDGGDQKGQTALMLAAAKEHMEVIPVLLAAGANAHLPDKAGKTAISLAQENGYAAIADYLAIVKNGPSARAVPDVAKRTAEKPAVAQAGEAANKQAGEAAIKIDIGGGLTQTFNFLTRQVITRDAASPSAPMHVQSFDDLPRQEAIAEAYHMLRAEGKFPPPFEAGKLDKPAVRLRQATS